MRISEIYIKARCFEEETRLPQKVLQLNITNFTFKGNSNTEEEYYLRDETGKILTGKIKLYGLDQLMRLIDYSDKKDLVF